VGKNFPFLGIYLKKFFCFFLLQKKFNNLLSNLIASSKFPTSEKVVRAIGKSDCQQDNSRVSEFLGFYQSKIK